jgi:hypothetical protein
MTKVYEFDGVSGEHSVRNATPTEIESLANTALEIENAAKEKAEAKAAVLKRLGITADEAALLLG